MKTPKFPKRPGKGYRFLTHDEVLARRKNRSRLGCPDIECYSTVRKRWTKGWMGDSLELLYRTRKPKGFFLNPYAAHHSKPLRGPVPKGSLTTH